MMDRQHDIWSTDISSTPLGQLAKPWIQATHNHAHILSYSTPTDHLHTVGQMTVDEMSVVEMNVDEMSSNVITEAIYL